MFRKNSGISWKPIAEIAASRRFLENTMGRKSLIILVLAAAASCALSAGASAQVYGSFVESCTRIEQRGPVLRALCRDVYGRFVPAQLDLRSCRGGDVSNQNGQLVCSERQRRAPRRYDNDRFREYYPPPPRGPYDPY